MFYILDSQNQMTDLNLELKDFGLNPSEWMILKEKSQTYQIRSKRDQNFILQGKTKRKGKKLKWEQLELISI